MWTLQSASRDGTALQQRSEVTEPASFQNKIPSVGRVFIVKGQTGPNRF